MHSILPGIPWTNLRATAYGIFVVNPKAIDAIAPNNEVAISKYFLLKRSVRYPIIKLKKYNKNTVI